ncbi:MAG: 3-hydroxyacyl-CoA dehydrogenase NAD-binding domain-containing protein [Chthoniobacterales bacterium]
MTIASPEIRDDKIALKAIHQQTISNGIVRIIFDRPDSSVNIFDSPTLIELEAIIEGLEKDVRAIIFESAKKSVFIAGADLKELARAEHKEQLVELGQRVFNRIAALRCVTIAAIHGACVGGGCELALACDYRIASSDKETRIGLPEVQLGLIPAWGGSTRLPRLIGLSKALSAILRGELMAPQKAFRAKLIDALVPEERLQETAEKFANKGKRHGTTYFLEKLLAPIIASISRRKVMETTRGNYPAALKAVEVVTQGFRSSIPLSLRLERAAILELAETEACQNLIRLFFLQEKAKHLKAPKAITVNNAAVIGAGVMGAGIAQWFSARGLHVLLRDIAPEYLAKGLMHASRLYVAAVRRKLMSPTDAQAGMDRIVPVEKEASLHLVDIVVEAAVEKMELKKQIFAQLEKVTLPQTVLATNTSALSITEIASALQYPERVVGLHFFNPVHRMKLVEVVRGDRSSDEAVDTAIAFAHRIGKLPVVVRDRPGFLVNRILMPYLLEAALLFEQGQSLESIDTAMLDFGMPMGPLRLLDEVGLDVAADVSETLSSAFKNRMQMPEFFGPMVAKGWKGRKAGTGFYQYHKNKTEKNLQITSLQKNASAVAMDKNELQQRMVFPMINEASRCLEEKVVEEAQDVDFGMIFGTGFAPFRGGLLRYADAVGIDRIVEGFEHFQKSEGSRFEASNLLLEMKHQEQKFYDDKNSRH